MFCNSTITDLFLFVFTQLILHYQNILPTIKTALSGLKPQQGDLVLQKGYKVTGWVDEQNNRVSEDTIINQSIILSPVVEMAETEPN